jgi:hypothetical protein
MILRVLLISHGLIQEILMEAVIDVHVKDVKKES